MNFEVGDLVYYLEEGIRYRYCFLEKSPVFDGALQSAVNYRKDSPHHWQIIKLDGILFVGTSNLKLIAKANKLTKYLCQE